MFLRLDYIYRQIKYVRTWPGGSLTALEARGVKRQVQLRQNKNALLRRAAACTGSGLKWIKKGVATQLIIKAC